MNNVRAYIRYIPDTGDGCPGGPLAATRVSVLKGGGGGGGGGREAPLVSVLYKVFQRETSFRHETL